MSAQAPGIPLSKVFQSMPYNELTALVDNIASMLLPLFAHRFPSIGSLYLGPDPDPVPELSSTAPTPTVTSYKPQFAFRASPAPAASSTSSTPAASSSEFHVGPIVSWPFFGSHRGELAHPTEIDRGPWRSTHAYLVACAEREVRGVILEHEGKAAPHRLHLDPGEIAASRHHHVEALPGDESDTSDEWDWEESEGEWEGGDGARRRQVSDASSHGSGDVRSTGKYISLADDDWIRLQSKR